jgi:N-acetylated-alpha-linked acidic dipeptidase
MTLACLWGTDPGGGLRSWPLGQRQAQLDYERALNTVPAPASLRAHHEQLGSEPHVAGTPGDQRTIERLAGAFARLGLQVRRHEFWAYLAEPIDAVVQITSPVSMTLPLREEALAQDPDSGHPGLGPGWNAYSGSGDVTGEVVYANYGTKEDFKKLRELGVEVGGRIVLARYGRNYRGYKAKFAEEAGAAGLIIYTDPDDSGYRLGIPYPEGGYANESSIQRGSIKTLAYPGDPLTPFVGATKSAGRLDPAEVALPRIPVQPVGWQAAGQIMSRMRGPAVPEKWQGGLPFAYRLTGGEHLRVRLAVRQRREIRRSENVIGILPGSEAPRQQVIIGCHHDAWGFGAGDPLAGTMILLESARSFAEQAQRGLRPARTIVFAAWGAEEFGIIGSVEWCEAHRDELVADAVAYINLDMAAMGPDFGSSAAPTLKPLIEDATRAVPQARSDRKRSVYESWFGAEHDGASTELQSQFGDLGGGSDHIGFYCHLGIPSAGLGGRGSRGVAYHSNYDTLAWYRHVVGADYEPALMLTRVANIVVARLANAPLLPLDPSRYAPDGRTHVAALRKRAEALKVELDLEPLEAAIGEYEAAAAETRPRLLEAVAAGRLRPQVLGRVNDVLMSMERSWLHEAGLPQRPWFRNLYAASDPDAGYAAWMLPALRHPIEARDPAGAAEALILYVDVFSSLQRAMRAIDTLLDDSGEP